MADDFRITSKYPPKIISKYRNLLPSGNQAQDSSK